MLGERHLAHAHKTSNGAAPSTSPQLWWARLDGLTLTCNGCATDPLRGDHLIRSKSSTEGFAGRIQKAGLVDQAAVEGVLRFLITDRAICSGLVARLAHVAWGPSSSAGRKLLKFAQRRVQQTDDRSATFRKNKIK